ncbi:hypothetical protein KRR26_29935 [Corallococcus sp. M34]|nr:hypothetical protein [Citreicoccus inhibens]MBU8899839.1 hypothetical protein [Citreicoccus inhibens]
MKRINTLHVQTMKTSAADYACSECPDAPWCKAGTLDSLLGLLGLS